ncbi:vacuolar protein sorting-associated protein 13D [Galendromus occidentalis]|uniref:Vacuolar protein sorting-associated protein 13D n=1 Tax=Galendromus occidentalis TaxID=34638 RepID=A0AAJ7SEI9_9ACAR|nr:vacuolar protein sorting-associated protein 13D [Galendromus occidentalis]
MLEGLVAWVLNNSVGKYVENLNTSQLSVGLLKGQVELEDLPLKKEAFRQVLFPLEIKNGYIGKVLINIPVTRLRSDPWVITIERLYVVLGPVPLDQYNGDLYEEIAQSAKLSKLDAFEAEWKSSRLSSQNTYGDSYTSWLTYGSSLFTSIVSNLQLKVQDVHIRYEDTVDGLDFAWGLMVKSASSEYAPDDNSKDQNSQSKGYVSQQLQLKGVSLYWDNDAMHIGDLEMGRMANCMDNLRNFCVRSNETSCEHKLLLSTPDGAQVLLSRNQSERPLRSRNEPRIKCTLQVSTLPILITDAQYGQMVRCYQSIDINHKKWKYQKWRPDVPVRGNAKAWWVFATKATTEQLMKRKSCATYEYALGKAREVRRYVSIYKRFLTDDNITKEDIEEKSSIERGYDFETLLALREIIMKRIEDECNLQNSKQNDSEKNGDSAQSGGFLQYWFPGWTGGYTKSDEGSEGAPSSQLQGHDNRSDMSVSTEASMPASQFEEELIAALNRLDDEHYFLRDATLAHVTFHLKTCTVTLQPAGRDLCCLKVEDVWAQLKSHPRARSYSVHTKVGSLQFTDKTLPTVIYQHLVSPHTTNQDSQVYLRSGQKISASDLFRPRSAPTPPPSTAPLFEVIYEKNPWASTADHRLVVNTQSLDIVYSPSSFKSIREFLTPVGSYHDMIDDAVQQHLEHLKQETKTNLRSKVDAMLRGGQVIQRWDLNLDICAPQIIVPETFTDRSSVAVMFDLGRLQFRNQASFDKVKIDKSKQQIEDDVDEDDFRTPCSTPPGDLDSTVVSEPKSQNRQITSPGFESCAVSEADFRERMYDRYTLNLQDMQVMVTTSSRESWKFAQLRGSSHLHVVDRFNISMRFERRLLSTDDPQFPSVIVQAQLPRLVLHISEQKVSALTSCLRLLGRADGMPQTSALSAPVQKREPLHKPSQSSVLFFGQFVIEQMSCEMQSQGKCLAELQVNGVQVTSTRYPHMQSLNLQVQGLLLVDAVQTHGSDFDLLLASHKHITMDSRSGSIRDSEPNSPISPASPKGYHCITPPVNQSLAPESGAVKPSMLTSLLSSLHRTISPAAFGSASLDQMQFVPRGSSAVSPIPVFPTVDGENNNDALISIELMWGMPEKDEDDNREQNVILQVGFNNLDVIANQETIVELVSFAQCIHKASQPPELITQQTSAADSNDRGFKASSIHVTFDFHRLNVLLLRSTGDKSSCLSSANLKLATATLSGAKISAVLEDSLKLSVVLGGLQVCDLLSGHALQNRVNNNTNHYVVNVGLNPDCEDQVPSIGKHLYHTSGGNEEESAALVLHIVREYPGTVDWTSTIKRGTKINKGRRFSRRPTVEIQDSQLKFSISKPLSISQLNNSLKMDLHMASVVYTHSPRLLLELASCAIEFRAYMTKLASSLKTAAAEVAKGIVGSELSIEDALDVSLSVILETPVIVLPCELSRPNVLVAHLGRMTVSSTSTSSYRVELKNTSLYSLDSNLSPNFDCSVHGRAMLHNTQIDLMIEQVVKPSQRTSPTERPDPIDDVWQLEGCVVGPLKVAVSKSQFAQLLDTLNEIGAASSDVTVDRAHLIGEQNHNSIEDSEGKLKYGVHFAIQEFIVEFTEEPGRAFARVAFQEFDVEMIRHAKQSDVNMSLRGLVMEDLYEEETSNHRILISSHTKEEARPLSTENLSSVSGVPLRYDYLSASNPNLVSEAECDFLPHGRFRCRSLPDILCTKNIFKKLDKRSILHDRKHLAFINTNSAESECFCPKTPPPSPTPSIPSDSCPEGTLVEISMATTEDCGNGRQRRITIDLNSLMVSVNVRPWVMVLDLLSKPAYTANRNSVSLDAEPTPHDLLSTTLEYSVQNFTLQLNSQNYEICEAQVRQLWFRSSMSPTSTDVSGRLGKVLVHDLTPFGSQVYQERFVTSGNEALHFKFTRSKDESDRYQLESTMTSVLVVYTHLFMSEIVNFISEFSQVQELLARMQNQFVPQPRQKAKVDLRIKAGSPLIVVPRNSHHQDALVLNLGSVDISTQFVQTECLNQVMELSLSEMDLYCGIYERDVTRRKSSLDANCPFNIQKKGFPLLDEKFEMRLRVFRNLDSEISHIEPDWTARGDVSRANITLDKSQYELISGILFENLSEGVHLQTSTPAPVVAPAPDDDAWVNLLLAIDLHNVTLNLVASRNTQSDLAKVEFIDSKLSVSTYTNGRKDVDLVSQEIRVRDTRFSNPDGRTNVFSDMLLPTRGREGRGLQMELHYRTFPNRLTLLLNNMRLMAIFDWFKQTAQFLTLPQPAENHRSDVKVPGYRDDTHLQPNEPMQLQLKLSMTDTEVVVVEDASTYDTNAVILKSTAVLTWHGSSDLKRPLICDLQNLEVFSCVLGTEDKTALSIIDPASISFEMNSKHGDAYELEASSHLLCIRLSYNDMTMFRKILECLPSQAVGDTTEFERNVSKLKELGFSHNDCVLALRNCRSQIDEAALWLLQNAEPIKATKSNRWTIWNLPVGMGKIRLQEFRVCFIDDCGNADVPLFELRLQDTDAQLRLDEKNWQINSALRIDYYNRILSGWEPLVEPVRIEAKWRLTSRYVLELEMDGNLNINITSSLIDIAQRVRDSWQDDRETLDKPDKPLKALSAVKRAPFVPFALKNSLGCAIEFATVTTMAGNREPRAQNKLFHRVEAGETVPFSFASQAKLRHQESHQWLVRQIVVRVEGCEEMEPVSVDRVGEYFRLVRPVNSTVSAIGRIVFHIELEGPALKMINVRSAFVVKNFTSDKVNVNITTATLVGAPQSAQNSKLVIESSSNQSLPFAFDYTSIKVRPENLEKLLAAELGWKGATSYNPTFVLRGECRPLKAGVQPYNFAVTVRREPFPNVLFTPSEKHAPSHTILLNAPVKLYNLLPMELHYEIEEPVKISGVVKNRHSTTFHQISTELRVVIGFQLDGYTCGNKLILDPGATSGPYSIVLKDAEHRSLMLRANVEVSLAGAYKIYVCAQYWLINHTGLPLIFKQDGVNYEAAGQPPEHEAARSVVPLLFSFCDSEAPQSCCMRLGNRFQLGQSFQPKWSYPFPLDSGVGICKLFLSSTNNSPDRVYNIGIYGKQGKGVFKDTHFIVFSPLFQLVNNTSKILEFAQKFAAVRKQDRHITSAMPRSSVAFHWPRVDLDPLLCIRTDNSIWSGGFHIDKPTSSTHIHIRTETMQSTESLFILVEVRQHYGTFIVTFTQPESVPPPMRIDNFSEVPIRFNQIGVEDEKRRYTVKAGSSMPYAWDEPTETPRISVAAPDGVCETYDMRTFKEGEPLCYENFFYIAFSGTFLEPKPAVPQKSARNVKSEELVLDVLPENRIVINRKDVGSRNQLWRMTAEQMLQHEGSSTPLAPGQPSSSHNQSGGRVFVLDIDAPAADPHRCVSLILRKPDPRRRSLQTWTFTTEGFLKCDIGNLFVQAKNGLKGLRKGGEAVLGPLNYYECTEYLPHTIRTPCPIPLHCAVETKKMRGGCGILKVAVCIDGPTIVLRITDFANDQVLPVYKSRANALAFRNETDHGSRTSSSPDIEVNVNFKQGVGISFINESEEILLVSLQNVLLSFFQDESLQKFDMSVRHLQVDNMLPDAERPCALYVTPESSRDEYSHLPAASIKASRLLNYNTDVFVFDYFMMSIKDTTLALEEKLMLKMFQMFRDYIPFLNEPEDLHLIEQRSMAVDALRESGRKFYFKNLRINPHNCKLSVLPARSGSLDEGLRQIKKQVGWSLIRFEDAGVHLNAFEKNHPFETLSFLMGTASAFYSKELQKQARYIMGNVDFFGSPLGFLRDVKGSFKEAISGRNPWTLVKGLTYGASNSAAKLTGSLSDTLKNLASTESSNALVVAQPNLGPGENQILGGLRGLGRGLRDGFGGLYQHPYEGLTNGLQGFMEGVGRGLVGSGVLPIAGVLDFATGVAATVRDSSNIRERPSRHRPIRLTRGPRGLLPCYSASVASGQMYLMEILAANASNPTDRGAFNEFFLTMHPLENGGQLIVSNKRILRVSSKKIMLDVIHLCELQSAHLLVTLGSSSLMLTLTGQQHKRMDCGDSDDATVSALREVVQCINYAVFTFEEERYRLPTRDEDESTELDVRDSHQMRAHE